MSATIFCQVIDVKSALLEINDFQLAVDQLSLTALRAVFGEMTMDQSLFASARASIPGCRSIWPTP